MPPESAGQDPGQPWIDLPNRTHKTKAILKSWFYTAIKHHRVVI